MSDEVFNRIDTVHIGLLEIVHTKSLTVILPTFNERGNVEELIEEITRSDDQGLIKRIIVVDDDSPDGLAEVVKQKKFQIDVICLHRLNRYGLSSAVLEGVMASDTQYVAVMDSDGQHTPKDLIAMVKMALQGRLDLVVGSRFLEREVIDSHSGWRHRASFLGNRIVNAVTKRPISDPLTGFFIIRRDLLSGVAKRIRPHGFKILFDILYALKQKDLRMVEFQIDFRERRSGESKLDSAVLLEFVEQMLARVTNGIVPERFLGFAIVGGSGIFVHLAVLYLFHLEIERDFLPSHAAATLVAIIWNYSLNNAFTFRRFRRIGVNWFKGLVYFCVISSVGATANVGVAGLLNASDVFWWASALAGVLVGVVFNFALARFIVWR